MDKQTFYSELSERLTKLDVSQEYISRHLKQFDGYFSEKSDEEISAEIEKLGDLDRVAARIKRMTDKLVANEASTENQDDNQAESENPENEIPAQDSVVKETSFDDFSKEGKGESSEQVLSDEDMIVFDPSDHASEHDIHFEEVEPEAHGTKRGIIPSKTTRTDNAVISISLDEDTIQKNRRKFWILFAVTLPITLSLLLATAGLFAMTFFAIAMVIIFAIGALIAIAAIGTIVSIFGIIFGAAQMLTSLPVGLYECGIAVIIGSLAMFSGILVYNFAVRLMPIAAKWLLVFAKYVARKYKELFIYLKKECVGL